MKLKRILLRWYKSFHLNYRGVTDKGEATLYRPWNKLSPSFAPSDEFPFIEIPVEDDITTIVGANESGKSHLLNAITKVVRGTGTDKSDDFARTDLCHYAGVRTRNVEAWPNIGLQFAIESEAEFNRINEALNGVLPVSGQAIPKSFALILAPDEHESKPACLYVEPHDQPIWIDEAQLTLIRALLPSVQFIDSHAVLSSEIPLARLLAAYGEKDFDGVGLRNRKSVEQALQQIRDLTVPAPNQAIQPEYVRSIESIQRQVKEIAKHNVSDDSLEMHLFKEILEINSDTLRFLYSLDTDKRGYVEGQIAKWNDELSNRLNLAHYWRQDEQFSLTINFKDGIVYFQIRDKTESLYTFKERSSGLKYFLSYYIQAKAMEMSSRNRNSIILMDEPDSALSVLAQRNLLAVFESLVSPESSNQTCQLIYTTHSPYLINRNFPRRIRVVKKEDAEEGTQYIEQARTRRYEPVRTALGIDSAPSLFLGSDNILLEGSTDQYLFTELIRVFATPSNVSEFLDLNSVVVVSADGVGNVENVLDQSRWADEPIPPTAVLLDSDEPAKDVIKRISENPGRVLIDRAFVATLDELLKPFGDNAAIVTLEDIVPRSIYAEAINAYFTKWLNETKIQCEAEISAALKAKDFGKQGLVAGTKLLFKTVKPDSDGDYDKMGVFQEVVALTLRRLESVDDSEMLHLKNNVIKLCDFVREALAKARVATAKHSTTQAIKRIVNDFSRLNKDNVPVTTLQRLFNRLEREAAPIGKDGEAVMRVINQSIVELDNFRQVGQDRIAGEQWRTWKARIEAIRKNPLTAMVEVKAQV